MTKRSIKSGKNVNVTRYTPTVWKTGDLITAAKLNKIEDQILLNEQNIASLNEAVKSLPPFIVTFSGTTADGNAACDKTHAEVKAAYDSGKQITARYVAGSANFQLNTVVESNMETGYDFLWGSYSKVVSNGNSTLIECSIDEHEVSVIYDDFEVSIPVPNPDNPSNSTK